MTKHRTFAPGRTFDVTRREFMAAASSIAALSAVPFGSLAQAAMPQRRHEGEVNDRRPRLRL